MIFAPSGIARIVIAGIALSALALAQTGSAVADQNSLIQQLFKKIAELEETQKQMQGAIAKLTAAATTASVPKLPSASKLAVPQPATAEPAAVEASDAPAILHTLGPVQFSGFSDFNYGRAWFEKQPPGGLLGTPRSFTIGDFDLFTNTRLSERWSLLGELLVTSDFSNSFSAELDRLMLTYKQNDYFKISFGKYNTALGYYPNAFHRAQYFQTAVGRPIMYSDEDNGGILPTHSIGLSATGKIPSGSLGLNWVAEVANGRSGSNPDVPVQNFVDENSGKAVNFGVYVRPEGLRGFQAGISNYRDTIHPAQGSVVDQSILTAYLVYVEGRIEWLSEGSLLRHTVNGSNQVIKSYTSYGQLAWAFGKTRPYARFDYQDVSVRDPIFGSYGRQMGPSFGITRLLSEFVALKMQYGRLGRRDVPTANGLTAQLAIAF